jgi:Protein of unknown function (DUF3788)
MTLWEALIADLARDHGLEPEGWVRTALPLRKGKRRIVYLSPREGFFLASFALGDRAIAAMKVANISVELGKRYAEGTALRIEVHTAADVELVKQVAAIKIAN